MRAGQWQMAKCTGGARVEISSRWPTTIEAFWWWNTCLSADCAGTAKCHEQQAADGGFVDTKADNRVQASVHCCSPAIRSSRSSHREAGVSYEKS